MKWIEKSLFVIVRTSAIALPLLNFAGFLIGGWSTYTGFAMVFGFYFAVEALLYLTGIGVATTRESEFRFLEKSGDLPLLIYASLYLPTLAAILILLPKRGFSTFELVGLLLSLAVTSGSVGALAAHEFIHRRVKWKQALGLVLFGSVNYAHFMVSHIHGHHKNVGTRGDWSTARRDESSYHFLYRALCHGLFGAWKIDPLFVARVLIAAALVWSSIYFLSGLPTLGFYLLYTFVAVVLSEMVNYLSHYGLARGGALERIGDHHSWESNNKVTNWFIFNAGKHSHHHKSPSAGYDALTLAYDKSPLPFGLPLMTLIAFVPPLYFKIMNELLDQSASQTTSPLLSPSEPRPRENRSRSSFRRKKSSLSRSA